MGHVPLAACYAQTVPAADAQAALPGPLIQERAMPLETVQYSSPLPAKRRAVAEDGAVRPFRVNIPQAALDDLSRRIAATRWPERETVDDFSQGVQLKKLKSRSCSTGGRSTTWRKAEAKLNALPQFVTNIDGLDIQFIHVASRHPNAMPLIMTHGCTVEVLEPGERGLLLV